MGPKKVDGQTVAAAGDRAGRRGLRGLADATPAPAASRRSSSRSRADNPRITKLVDHRQDRDQGQDIVALKVTKNADRSKDGKQAVGALPRGAARPRVDHAGDEPPARCTTSSTATAATRRSRSWSTRTSCGSSRWPTPTATTSRSSPASGCGARTCATTTATARSRPATASTSTATSPTKWGYDNEGSSPEPGERDLPRPGPGSEPETQALDRFAGRVGFEFFVNYHSAAELLLYGTGWQVATPTPDDVIYEAMAGDDANPAVPGYDPDISAELYTTNGDTDTHMTERYGTLGFTPEMSTCEAASDVDPGRRVGGRGLRQRLRVPRRRGAGAGGVREEHPVRAVGRRVGRRPGRPGVGGRPRAAEDFRVDSFDVSYGDPQTVAVVAKRALRRRAAALPDRRRPACAPRASRSGAAASATATRTTTTTPSSAARCAAPSAGDEVEVWFTGAAKPRHADRSSSERFTYTVESDTGDDVLVIANEDYTGVNPTYPAGHRRAEVRRRARGGDRGRRLHRRRLGRRRAGRAARPRRARPLRRRALVPRRQPDHPGPRGRAHHRRRSASCPDIAVAERQQYLTMAVRDYLNEGGKLVHAGETAQYQGLPGISDAVGGLTTGSTATPTAECVRRDRSRASSRTA